MDNGLRKAISSRYQRFFKRGVAGITSSSRVLPDFIIIGTVRSGTTSLYYNICEHPSVLPADYDEIGFFDSNYELGLEWYRSMFPTQKQMKELEQNSGLAITGEDTPFYFWKKEVVERISEILPNVKLIGIFRNPIDRAYSNYNLGIRKNTEKMTFVEAIDEEEDFLKNHSFREAVERKRSYISKGMYSKQMKLWLEIFSKKQIHILSTEEMKKDPQSTLEKVFKFLEISDYTIKSPQKEKVETYEKMSLEVRERLSEFYKPYNEEFFQIIGKRFDWN